MQSFRFLHSALIVAVLISLASPWVHAVSLNLNDVSILLPFPRSLDETALRPETKGRFGELLPRQLFEGVPPLDSHTKPENYERLRVVGIRLDPCFPKSAPFNGCQAQIRLVWQPLEVEGRQPLRFADAALHTFYEMSDADFAQLVTKLEGLKAADPGLNTEGPLRVHPVLLEKGMSSSYARHLLSTLLEEIGERRLKKVTFMQLAGQEKAWIFGGFIYEAGELTIDPVPRGGGMLQSFLNGSSDLGQFLGGAFPAPSSTSDILGAILARSDSMTTVSPDAAFEILRAAVRIENPRLHNPRTMDCVSCHISEAARLWVAQRFPSFLSDPRYRDATFSSPFDLTQATNGTLNTKRLRAFGYDGTQPVIHQRTINETAGVLEKLGVTP